MKVQLVYSEGEACRGLPVNMSAVIQAVVSGWVDSVWLGWTDRQPSVPLTLTHY